MVTLTRKYPAIVQMGEKRHYPLSYQQERVLYLDQLTPDGALWNLISAKRLTGRLDTEALRGAVEELAECHAALRTRIEWTQPPVQSFVSFSPEQFRLVELLPDEADSREKALAEWFSRECRKPIAIRGGGPLFQALLVRYGADRALLVLKLHHIISDATTFGLLWRDLKQLYNRRTGGEAGEQPVEQPESGIAYGDYALWQKETFAEERTLEQEAYWLERFKGELPVLDLPADFAPPPGIRFRGGLAKLDLPAELINRLWAQSLDKRVLLFSALLSAYGVLLHKCCRQDDVVIGTVFAGRHYSRELSRAAGFFVNTVAIRTEVDGEQSWEDLLKTVHERVDEAYYMQDYPFERLVRKLNPDRGHNRNPIFRAMFNMVTEAKEEGSFAGLEEKWEEAESEATQADLLFDIRQRDGETAVWAEYNSDLFRPETVRRLLELYRNLLEDIADRPEARVKELRMTDEAEREKLLKVFNDTRAPYPAGKCIHELFEEQARRTPDAVALSGAGTVWTYAELDARSARLARRLQSRGIGPESVVGVLAGRSPEVVLGILAVVRAGGAYLPIDPAYPSERIGYMLRDSGADLVLLQGGLKPEQGWDYIEIDCRLETADDCDAPCDSSSPVHTVRPDNLAYIMYTSGSTGRPKGVMIEHRNVVRLVKNPGYLEFEEGARMMLAGSPSFDAATFEIWGALLNGLGLYLAEDDIFLRADKLGEFLLDNRINLLMLTTPLFRQLAEQRPDLFAPLDMVLAGGDILPAKQAKSVRDACPGLTLLNIYGPTENTAFTTFHVVGEEEGERIPIGRPIANTTVYILDRYGELMPIGVAGELCAGGDGLARGYIHRPELTADKFIPHPFFPDERLYRTGDLARWLPGGEIEYLGRIDQQVKIRGYRIEPGEIEAALSRIPGVGEAALIPREDSAGEKRLYAYLVCDDSVNLAEVRRILAGELPEYMIPFSIERLDKLPLNRNGKLDVRALPEASGREAAAEYKSPKTWTERRLGEVWKQVLHVDRAGLEDHFFEQGGHSLKATELLYRINEHFGVDLLLKDIFENPTLSKLAETVGNASVPRSAGIRPVAPRDSYPVSSSQKRMYLVQHMLPAGGTEYNIPMVMRVEGELDRKRLEWALEQLAERHESFRTCFEMRDGQPVQIIRDKADFRLEYAEEQEYGSVDDFIRSFIRPFRLDTAPLARAALLRRERGEKLLLLDMHHIISDGVSMGIVFKEIAELYRGEMLSPLPVQYKDYAVWQSRRLLSEEAERQEAYWLDNLQGELPVLEIIPDYPRPSVISYSGNRIGFKGGKELLREVKRTAAKNGTTLYMFLLAAYQILLSKYSRQEDILVGTPIAGRNHPDIRGIVGMFVNTLVMRNRPAGDLTFREFLKQVRNSALQAYQNQDYPFDRLVEQLGAGRDISRNPLFDAMFAMPMTDTERLDMGEWALIQQNFDYPVAKFDLTLTVTELDGEMSMELEYRTDLYKQETMEALARHYLHIVEQAVTEPDQRLADMRLLTEPEQERIISRFNDTRRPCPTEKCVHELFEEQAGYTPGAIAVSGASVDWTYRTLNARANQLARMLRSRGIGPESVVGIVAGRSPHMILGILAILKAGGAYLPIDPSYPPERIAFMLRDSGAALMLVQEGLPGNGGGSWIEDRLGEASGFAGSIERDRVVLLEAALLEESGIEDEADEDNPAACAALPNASKPDTLAYVMYTSGSTGQPKGVMVEHRNIIRLVKNGGYAELRAGMRILLTGSPSFDATTFEIWGALLNGLRLYVAEDDILLKADKLGGFIAENRINLLWLTAPLFRQLADRRPELFAPLDTLLVGGDVLPPKPAARVREVCPDLTLLNMYGPTENTTFTTFHRVGREPGSRIPIGKPIGNTAAYIVDNHGKLLPPGVAGELWIGGGGLARGYMNRPGLNAEKFTSAPFIQGERVYRSGDLARWLPDGSIEFLGRIDQQVKIRGYRIEPEEIERVLMGHPDIREAAVVVNETREGEKRIIAYLVVPEAARTNAKAWRGYLEERLPSYMLPALFIPLDSIALKANGKVDMAALPGPEEASGLCIAEEQAPRTATERQIAELVKEVFQLEEVHMNDELFLIGGNSLLFINVALEVEKRFGVELSIVDVMESATVSELSTKVEQMLGDDLLVNR